MAANIVVDPLVEGGTTQSGEVSKAEDPLVQWIVEKVDKWEQHRDNNYKIKWLEYYRLWRGVFHDSDKSRKVGRSRIIAPALQQAIESNVADIEDTLFSRERWFNIEDDVIIDRAVQQANKIQQQGGSPEEQGQAMEKAEQDLSRVVSNLIIDMDLASVKQALGEIILNGAIYGTGIGKLVPKIVEERTPVEGTEGVSTDVTIERKVVIKLVPVQCSEFDIDDTARNVDEALGMAHITMEPRHEILIKQAKGIYKDGFIPVWTDDRDLSLLGEVKSNDDINKVEILEYHGKIPKSLLPGSRPQEEDFLEEFSPDVDLEGELTDDAAEFAEVIVTIANRSAMLSVSRNPFIMQDRSFIAYQHDTVPNRFWGRGVAEKGYNSQKALDTELRAHIDALAMHTYPMTIVNTMLMPRTGDDFSIRPGRSIFANGPPGEAIAPFQFPAPDATSSFRQAAELERMVTVATASLDTAAPIGVNPRNDTAAGQSMMMGATLKRAKRTMRNVEYQLLAPLVHKYAWRQMQFNTERYPVRDYKFVVTAAMGASAREFETAQLGQILQTMPPQSTGYYITLKGILKNFNIDEKEKLLEILDGLIQQSMQPPKPPEPTVEEQIKLQREKREDARFEHDKIKDELDAARKDEETEAEAERDRGEAIWNQSEAVLNIKKAEVEILKAKADFVEKQTRAMLNIASAEAAEAGTSQLNQYKAIVDKIMEDQARIAEEVVQRGETTAQGVSALSDDLQTSLAALSQRQTLMETGQVELTNLLQEASKVREGATNISLNSSDGSSGDVKTLLKTVAGLEAKLENMTARMQGATGEATPQKKKSKKPIKVERSGGLVTSVGGRPATRDSEGKLSGVK